MLPSIEIHSTIETKKEEHNLFALKFQQFDETLCQNKDKCLAKKVMA